MPLDQKIRIALLPEAIPLCVRAVVLGGADVTSERQDARALIWSRHGAPDELARTIASMPSLEWVQLPSAGVDNFVEAGVLDTSIVWTSAKGAYAVPVAEHALTLTLALLGRIPLRARATSWGEQLGETLVGKRVIVGAGGFAREYARLTAPFGVHLTVCRRENAPVDYAAETIDPCQLADAVRDADVVVLAAPLTRETRGLFGARLLSQLKHEAVLIHVGRGPVIVTDDLVAALRTGRLGGAGLDVTEPEPLPDNHPLWSLPNAQVTPHSADTPTMIEPLLARRIQSNVESFLQGGPLAGVVDVERGY
jgi:phosphoglycerate dehydrogenase-like enzyme